MIFMQKKSPWDLTSPGAFHKFQLLKFPSGDTTPESLALVLRYSQDRGPHGLSQSSNTDWQNSSLGYGPAKPW